MSLEEPAECLVKEEEDLEKKEKEQGKKKRKVRKWCGRLHVLCHDVLYVRMQDVDFTLTQDYEALVAMVM